MAAPKKAASNAVKEFSFHWKGKDRTGKAVSGEMRASGEAVVKNTLRRQGVNVTSVKKIKMRGGSKITETDIAMFTRQLATMLKSGVPLLTSFDIVAKGHANPAVTKLLMEIKTDIETGSSLTQAFRKHPLQFDTLYCNLVQAGEQAGILDALLARLATYKEKILGVIVRNDLKWSSHTNKLKSECNYHLSVLRRLRRVLGNDQMKRIAEGLLMSRLRYCLAVHGAEQLRFDDNDKRTSVAQELQGVQNEMLRIITGRKRIDHPKIKDMLESTNMLSINQLIGYGITMEAWKAKAFNIPQLSTLLSYERGDDRTLRSNSNNAAVSSTIEPFAICARNLWNRASDRFKTTNLLIVAKTEAKKMAKSLPI